MGEIIVSIDIGTSKVHTLIGLLNKDGQVEVLGEGTEPCNGLKKGIIVDLEGTSNSISSSVEKAESMANLKIGSAYVNIIGSHVSVINNRASIGISSDNREISVKDVQKVLSAVRDISIPEDRQIIDVIPRQYIVDGYDEIVDPVGMVGVKLEVEADIIIGKITSVQNIVKSIERSNIKVDGIIIEALATSEVVLTTDEKEMGVIMLDVGGGVTDISVFKNNRLVFYDSLPIGGDHISSDISIGLKIPYPEADKIKRQYELALTSLIKNDQKITVTDLSDNKKKSVMVSEVVEIIEARVHEIFYLCKELLYKANVDENFVRGVVMTGGGISYVDGGVQIANEVFDIPVRLAVFKGSSISKPEYATASGIVKYVSGLYKGNNLGSEVKEYHPKETERKSGLFGKLGKILSDLF